MSLKLTEAEAAKLTEDIRRWAADPVTFVFEVFGPGYEEENEEPLVVDRWQEKGLRALVTHEPHGLCNGTAGHTRCAAKACKGPGKTAWKAWIAWWRMICCRHHQGFCVSITGDNLKANLWKELAHWQRFSPLLSKLFEHKAEEIVSVDHPKTWWLKARSFPQDADKTKQAETLAGLHAKAVTILLDEVGSFPQGVLDAAEAIFNTVGVDALLVVGGNATTADGPLYRIWTEGAEWYLLEITGDPEDPDRSPRIDIDEARRQIAKHGRNDPVVMVNILGKFPPRSGNKLLGPEEVTAAIRRVNPLRTIEQHALVWGLDVAGEGLDPDEATLYKRQGPAVYQPSTWRNVKTLTLAEKVANEYEQARRVRKAPKRIFVDKGGVGRGCWEMLERLIPKDVVIGVDFGSTAIDDQAYEDRRTEMWCLMALDVRDVVSLPDIPELRRDLTAPSIGVEVSGGRTRRKLESKKQMRARGIPSPDHGDGLALTYAAPVLPDVGDEIIARRQAFAPTDFDPYAVMEGGH